MAAMIYFVYLEQTVQAIYINARFSHTVCLFQNFEWPVARPVESEEQIEIQLFNYNKYLSNR